MKTIPIKSDLQQPVEAPNEIKQEMSKSQYRWRDMAFSLFYPDVDQIFQAINPNSGKSNSQTDPTPEKEPNQEILDPERERVDREFPKKDDDDDIDPNRNISEEDNDLNDGDGAIIKEPTRELDDHYLPGHGEKENTPPIKKEF